MYITPGKSTSGLVILRRPDDGRGLEPSCRIHRLSPFLTISHYFSPFRNCLKLGVERCADKLAAREMGNREIGDVYIHC